MRQCSLQLSSIWFIKDSNLANFAVRSSMVVVMNASNLLSFCGTRSMRRTNEEKIWWKVVDWLLIPIVMVLLELIGQNSEIC